MPSPGISQGVLNRINGTVSVAGFPELNVVSGYLSREGIRLALEGTATHYMGTMTGAVASPEVYLSARVTIHLLKTQPLSDLYKTQMETSSLIGDLTIRPDVPTGEGLSPYDLTNCSIMAVRELNFSGEDAVYAVELGGYYNINSTLFDG